MDDSISMRDADKKLDAALKQEVDDRTAAISTLSSDLSAEIDADVAAEAALRSAADVTLQGNIDAEATARASADSAEAAARVAADNTLQSNIDSEAATRLAADNTLQSNIDAEETARIAADAVNASAISDEETARIAAVAAEEAARIAGDASTLASAKAYTDTEVAALVDSAPAVLDTLNELAAALGDDANFATTVANDIAAAKAELRGSVDATRDTMEELSNVIDAETAARIAGDDALGDALQLEEDARVAADLSATTDRAAIRSEFAAADSAIQADLDSVKDGEVKVDFKMFVSADPTPLLEKPYTILEAGDAGCKVDMPAGVHVVRHVLVNSISESVEIVLPMGVSFDGKSGPDADKMVVHPMMKVTIIIEGSMAFLF
jgi:hypothetical protein